VIGFLNYLVPVYLNRLGVSQSVIGGVLILYGLCMIYLGPFVSQYIDATHNKRLFVITGCVIGGCAFLGFSIFSGIIGTVLAVMLVGLSSCFVLASQTVYALTLDVTKQLGAGRAIGIFRASSRIGQMLGPILFGWLIIATDTNQSVTYFGLGYLATAILFALATSAKPVNVKETICHEQV
jgi:MFS family permease